MSKSDWEDTHISLFIREGSYFLGIREVMDCFIPLSPETVGFTWWECKEVEYTLGYCQISWTVGSFCASVILFFSVSVWHTHLWDGYSCRINVPSLCLYAVLFERALVRLRKLYFVLFYLLLLLKTYLVVILVFSIPLSAFPFGLISNAAAS